MKKVVLTLSLCAVALFAVGCASTPPYASMPQAHNALAFTTVTDPKELVKWSGDKYLFRSLRTVDTYYFQVPDTGYNPGGVQSDARYDTAGSDMMTGSDRGMGAPGSYQSGSGGYKIIEYRPGHVR